MWTRIFSELKAHAPFTVWGAISGIVVMVFFNTLPYRISYTTFYLLHPAHVLVSAFVTASMYKIHKEKCSRKGCNHWMLLVVGYLGAIGITTVSDSIIPFLGEVLLDMPHRHAHIGFLEAWWLVNPIAILGIAIACFRPSTKFPHAGHVLLSTWASLFHMMMAAGGPMTLFSYVMVFVFLFISVWLPCCIGDIVFPLLFVRDKDDKTSCGCHH